MGHDESAADVIENPVTQRIVTFLPSSAAALQTRWVVEAGAPADPLHVHPNQVETITVFSGRIRQIQAGQSDRMLGPRSVWEIQAGHAHSWAVVGDGPAELGIEFRPALRTRELLIRLFELARLGRTNSKGVPRLPQVLVLADAYEAELRLARPPWAVQRAFLSLLAPTSRACGYRA